MVPSERTLSIPGLRLAARVWGPADGSPVLALHGWQDNAASFDRLAPLLPDLQLWALDLPGHGLSEHRHATATYDFVTWIPDVVAAADALGWQRFSLLGHSLGGAVALCTAGTVPARIERVALIDGFAPFSGDPAQAPARLARAITEHRRWRGKKPTVYADPDAAAARLCEAVDGLDPASARPLVERGTVAVADGVTWRHDLRLRAGSLLRLSEQQILAFLRRVSAPTLLIRPDRGWPVDDPMAERARYRSIARLQLERIDGRHHVHLVDPAPVARLIRGFFADGQETTSSP